MDYQKRSFAVKHPSGMDIRGYAFEPAQQGRYPAVILSHGFNGTCEDTLDMGERMACAGIAAYLYDFRGGGERTISDGVMREMMTLETELEDLALIEAYVRSQPCVAAERVVLAGCSQGGMVSILHAQRSPGRFPALVLWFPALVIPADARQRLAQGICDVGGIPICPAYDRIAAAIDPFEKMPEYDGSVLLLHGDCDSVVPFRLSVQAQTLFPHSRLIIYGKADHGFEGRDYLHAMEQTIAHVKEVCGC